MRSWTFPVALEPERKEPLFLQIARVISDDVARGRLRHGDALPGSRTLAVSLGVHRTTVVAAYGELEAQGWVEPRRGHGTVVAARRPDAPRPAARRPRSPERVGFDVEPAELWVPSSIPEKGTLNLAAGVPDLRLLPFELLSRAYRRAGRSARTLLAYSGDPYGEPCVRAAIAGLVSGTRGVVASTEDVLVAHGSQMAIYLAAASLIRPGDAVAVEEMGYQAAFRAFQRLGAELVAVPVDEQGLDVGALARIVERRKIRAVYVTPHHQYPTTAVMSAERRLTLMDLARRERFAIVEDDYDQEFHYDGRPVLPLASADDHGVVIYVGTLAKVLAPGLRLGYVVAPRPLLRRMAAERTLIDRQGDWVVERAVANLFEDGDLVRHVRRMRRIYQGRRDAMVRALRRRLGSALSFRVPRGGIALWARVNPDIDVDAWQKRAQRAGVVFGTARSFTLDGSRRPFARFAYAALDEREIRMATDVLARTV